MILVGLMYKIGERVCIYGTEFHEYEVSTKTIAKNFDTVVGYNLGVME